MSLTTYNTQIDTILNEIKKQYLINEMSFDGEKLEIKKKEKTSNDVNYGFNSLNAKQSKITLSREIRSGRFFKVNTDIKLDSLEEIDNRPIGKKWNNVIMWDKKQFINKYITNDNSITNQEKEELLTKIYKYLDDKKPITQKNIEYDPNTCQIIKIDYKIFK